MTPILRGFPWGASQVAAVLVIAASGCQLLPVSSGSPTFEPTSSAHSSGLLPTESAQPLASAQPALPAPTAVASNPPPDAFEFVRWLSREIELFSELGGGELVGSSNDYETAAVVGRTIVNGMEWIRVQTGFAASNHFVTHGWAPERVAGLGQAYEPFVPQCPDHEPTLGDLIGMPLQALSCFGSRVLTLAPIQVRNEGSELSFVLDGEPAWLAEGGEQVAYWFPEWQDRGSMPIYIDPASDLHIPGHSWVELSGQLDHPAAQSCSISSSNSEIVHIATVAEAVLLCRGRFVVTGVRQLSEVEIPVEPVRPTPGPEPEATVPVDMRALRAPLSTRVEASAVWTGSEVLIWGGANWNEDWDQTPRADGVAYKPGDGSWREFSDGPLSPRRAQVSAWTGDAMLVWGGYDDRGPVSDGASYDPITDTWREIAPSPIRASFQAASVWSGTELWIAVTRHDEVNVAAYDPASDSWRRPPSPSGRAGDGTELHWTGTELLLMNSNLSLQRIEPSADNWTPVAVDFHGPTSWTGSLLIGSRHDNLAQDPFGWEPWSYPVAWDPATSSLVDTPLPPHTAWSTPVWTGRHLLFADDGLALDMESDHWLDLDIEYLADVPFDYRDGAIRVWTGDRLVVWGGYSGCPGYSPRYDVGYELIPEFGASASTVRFGAIVDQGREHQGVGQGGTLQPERLVGTHRNFAC